jgi:2'-5' RNA ligase
MRLFVAIYPPKEYLDLVRDIMRKFDKEKRNLRPVPLDQVHLTVRFIGSKVTVSSKQKIAKQLAKFSGSYPHPIIAINKLHLGFPRQNYPSILYLSLQPNQELNEFVDAVHKNVREVGLRDTILWKKNDTRNYHLTVGRLKPAAVHKSFIRKMQEAVKKIELPTPETFSPTEMYLVESTVTPTGPVYKKLDRIAI